MGSTLVVGVHTDEEIERNKGPPLSTLAERVAALEACRWCDLVVPGAPYVTQVDVLERHGCSFAVHGDDISTDAYGRDAYALVKAAGRFRICRRTDGISTTDIVNRLLAPDERTGPSTPPLARLDLIALYARDSAGLGPAVWVYRYDHGSCKPLVAGTPLPSTRREFYLDGTWDVPSSQYIAQIRELARAHDPPPIMIMGIHADSHRPILTLLERVLMLLATKYTAVLIIDAPISPSASFLADTLSLLLRSISDRVTTTTTTTLPPPQHIAIQSTDTLRHRVESRQEIYRERQLKKTEKSSVEETLARDQCSRP